MHVCFCVLWAMLPESNKMMMMMMILTGRSAVR